MEKMNQDTDIVSQYLSDLTEQITYSPARKMIRREYEDHIIDEIAYQREKGLSEEDAISSAVEQMGDPISVGKQLDRIHKPKRTWPVLLIVISFMILCLFVHHFVWYTSTLNTRQLSFNWLDMMVILALFVTMGLCPYTVYRRYCKYIAAFILVGPLIHQVFILFERYSVMLCDVDSIINETFYKIFGYWWKWACTGGTLLYVPVYGFLLANLKGKNKSVFRAIALMVVPLLIFFDYNPISSKYVYWNNLEFWRLFVGLLVVFVVAVWKDILPLPKRKTTVISCLVLLGSNILYALFDYIVICGGSWSVYKYHSGSCFFGVQFSEHRLGQCIEYLAERKEFYPSLESYYLFPIVGIRDAKWFGMSDKISQELAEGGNIKSALAVNGDIVGLMHYFGIIPVVFAMLLLFGITIWLLLNICRQRNTAGKVAGIGAGAMLLFQMLYSVLQICSLTVGGRYTGLFPILASMHLRDYSSLAEVMMLYGMLISMYRYQSVVGTD